MALTEYDKKTLSQSEQKKIQAATDKWNAANEKGDKAGMEAAAKEAAAIRNSAGYKTDSSGNYIGSISKNSQYTGTGDVYNPNTDYSVIGRSQMDSGASASDVFDTFTKRYLKASGTEGLQQYVNDDFQNEMWNYIQNNMQSQFGNNTKKEETAYESKYDPQIDRLLKQILTRESFSYNPLDDQLYQQYANMYKREGERAMKETMAEAASGAGGMNSYAVSAAQQASNYYTSQLNDTIPQLYQLAYEMYLSDIERQIQNLGILQNADATQYARYRDTMSDYYNDRDFAYGKYLNDVAQGNWQKTFDYNSMIDERDFDYNALWTNKQWDANQEQIALENQRHDEETAKEEVWRYIGAGIKPSADLIAKAGMNEEDIDMYIAAQRSKTRTLGDPKNGLLQGGDEFDFEDEEPLNNAWQKGMEDLGLGYVYKPDHLLRLDEAGAIYEREGKLYWAAGWNAQNYKSKLNGPILGISLR